MVKKNFEKSLMILAIAMFLLIYTFGPIVNGVNLKLTSSGDTGFDEEQISGYLEVHKKKLIWNGNDLISKEEITKKGTPPPDWEERYEKIEENEKKHILKMNKENKPPTHIINADRFKISNKYIEKKSVTSKGDWSPEWSFTNPWAYAWTDISRNGKYAHMNAGTGKGDAWAPDSILAPGYADAGIYFTDPSYGMKWEKDDTDGAIMLYSPSHINGVITNFGIGGASANVYIGIEDWYNGEEVDYYIECLYQAAGIGSIPFDDDLDETGIIFPLKKNHIYVVDIHAQAYGDCGPTPDDISHTDIKSVKFKEAWWWYKTEQECSVEITRPKPSCIYFHDKELPFSGFTRSIVIFDITVEADAVNADEVKFTLIGYGGNSKSKTDKSEPFSKKFSESIGILRTITATAYYGDQTAHDSINVFGII